MTNFIIGADHAGFDLKEAVKSFLINAGQVVTDVGTYDCSPVDYPDLGAQVAGRVSAGEFSRGLLFCGSGVGMNIIANKFPGIRAVLALDEEMAVLSRKHNDTNILVLAGRCTDEKKAVAILRAWLETPFEGERHQVRLDKIRKWEQTLCRKNNGTQEVGL